MKLLVLHSLFTLVITATALSLISQNESAEGRTASLEIDQENGNLYGWAAIYATQKEADKRAMTECEENGEVWTWAAVVKEHLTPIADQWMDAVEENLYGYVGDLKDEAYTRKELEGPG